MFSMGGGGGGVPFPRTIPPRSENPPLNPPPNAPFFKFGFGRFLSMISDFRESPPPWLWVSFIKKCKQYQGPWATDCVRRAAEVALSLAPDFLPYCQLAIVRGVCSLLQRAGKCYSQLRPPPPPHTNWSGMHYACVAQCILQICQTALVLLPGACATRCDDAATSVACDMKVLLPIWQEVYQQQMQLM